MRYETLDAEWPPTEYEWLAPLKLAALSAVCIAAWSPSSALCSVTSEFGK